MQRNTQVLRTGAVIENPTSPSRPPTFTHRRAQSQRSTGTAVQPSVKQGIVTSGRKILLRPSSSVRSQSVCQRGQGRVRIDAAGQYSFDTIERGLVIQVQANERAHVGHHGAPS
ncbi:hypothetical protein D9611_014045 [Ephemerocybe angulata]|uniref:Uncharacterized protein n=1 Tax=Ephemerocybe angulata TaxID=980116 RepID=A0A8H5ERJ2_9AGAR|nr:hypothetical protein D9611_014045 [Tulosesus angulatus]